MRRNGQPRGTKQHSVDGICMSMRSSGLCCAEYQVRMVFRTLPNNDNSARMPEVDSNVEIQGLFILSQKIIWRRFKYPPSS